MATYYVDPLGTDDGSHGTASGTGAWATLKYAMQSGGLAHGDLVMVAPGTYSDSPAPTTNFSGDASSGPVVFRASDAGVVWDKSVAINYACAIASGDFLEIDGFSLTNSNSDGLRFFIINQAAGGKVRLINCTTETVVPVVHCAQVGEFEAIDSTMKGCTSSFISADNTASFTATLTRCAVFDGYGITVSSGFVNLAIDGCVFAGMTDACLIFTATSPQCIISLTDSAFNVGSAGYSDYWLSFNDACGVYYRDTPDKWISSGNRIWSLDTSSWTSTTFNRIVTMVSVYPLLGSENWMADTGVTAAQVAAGTVSVSGTTFGEPSPAFNNNIMFMGDSIAAGSAANIGSMCWEVLNTLTGQVVDGDTTAFSGLASRGLFWDVDYAISVGHGRIGMFLCGVNDISADGSLTYHRTNTELAEDICASLDKFHALGGIPVWLGIGPEVGGEVTVADAVNDLVEAHCLDNGYPAGAWLDEMRTADPVNWTTTYFADLATNVHPNDTGHALIAQLAYELWLKALAIGKRNTTGLSIGIGL